MECNLRQLGRLIRFQREQFGMSEQRVNDYVRGRHDLTGDRVDRLLSALALVVRPAAQTPPRISLLPTDIGLDLRSANIPIDVSLMRGRTEVTFLDSADQVTTLQCARISPPNLRRTLIRAGYSIRGESENRSR